MESKVNYTVVGAFVLLLGAALIAAVLWLGSERSYRRSYDTYVVYMRESVSGLSPDAPVRYRGVQVGRVRRIALAENSGERVRLTVEIEQGTPVREDTVAMLVTQGLTGIAHVELAGGSRESPPLKVPPGEDYPVIDSVPSLFLRLDNAVSELLANLNQTSERINSTLDGENRIALKRSLASLDTILRTFAGRAQSIDAALAGAARTMDHAAVAMESAAQVSARMPALIERIERSTQAFDRMAVQGARAGESAARAGESAARAMDSAQAGLQQINDEAVPEVRALVAELRELTANLRRLSDDLARNPGIVLYGRPPRAPGPGE